MITIFEEGERSFNSLGLGTLKDAISCSVGEVLNDGYELEMTYPVKGVNFSKIKVNRIIYCKPNPYSGVQPFRIYSISKPINGTITIKAEHISYDMNGCVVTSLPKGTLRTVLDEIQNGTINGSPFSFHTDILSDKTYQLTAPCNMRALLMGDSGSLLDTYKCELIFDKFDVELVKVRGKDRGVEIRYAKNMTDLSHESTYDNLYNGVYPYYHTETSSSTTTSTTTGEFKKVYIVGTKPFEDGWLSFTSGGESYHPIDAAPVQIASDGEYKDKVYSWDTLTQRYIEKIYNQMVTLVEGVISPDWIYIDWSTFPNVICKAGKEGYFKTTTATAWGDKKKVGDIIFQGSILSSNTVANIIINYSEVIPDTSSSSSDSTVTDIVHVELPEKIMYLDSKDARAMKYNRILSLDLTQEFDTTPTVDALKAKANEYITKNKIGEIKTTTDVSFIDLSMTTEGCSIEDFERIELGDVVTVIYEDLGVDIKLRAIKTEYDAISEKYIKVTLGDKPDTISANSIQNGDNVSSLTNDVGYADITTVKKLIAETITADYIIAKNAQLTKAQIDQLSTARIECSGIIEASQFILDTIVAKMLTTENAEISKVLTAGKINVKGNIDILSGSITIADKDNNTTFVVDSFGNMTANSVNITGGELDIGKGQFTVTPTGLLSAKGANISGTIYAIDGSIGGFFIDKNGIYTHDFNWADDNIPTRISGIYISATCIKSGQKFSVDDEGNVIASSANISGDVVILSGSINLGTTFSVTKEGYLTSVSGKIGGFSIGDSALYNDSQSTPTPGDLSSVWVSIGTTSTKNIGGSGATSHTWVFTAGSAFGITSDGKVYANDIIIKGGSFNIGAAFAVASDGSVSIGSNFSVSPTGTVSIKSGAIQLGAVIIIPDSVSGSYTSEEWDNGANIQSITLIHYIPGTTTIKSVRVTAISDGSTLYNADISSSQYTLSTVNQFTTLSINCAILFQFQASQEGSVGISITVTYNESSYYNFNIDNTGNVSIISGSINLGNGNFTVSNSGELKAISGHIGGLSISSSGLYYGSTFYLSAITETNALSNSFWGHYMSIKSIKTDKLTIHDSIHSTGTADYYLTIRDGYLSTVGTQSETGATPIYEGQIPLNLVGQIPVIYSFLGSIAGTGNHRQIYYSTVTVSNGSTNGETLDLTSIFSEIHCAVATIVSSSRIKTSGNISIAWTSNSSSRSITICNGTGTSSLTIAYVVYGLAAG